MVALPVNPQPQYRVYEIQWQYCSSYISYCQKTASRRFVWGPASGYNPLPILWRSESVGSKKLVSFLLLVKANGCFPNHQPKPLSYYNLRVPVLVDRQSIPEPLKKRFGASRLLANSEIVVKAILLPNNLSQRNTIVNNAFQVTSNDCELADHSEILNYSSGH
ncbi:hypothetical protein CFPU101_17030 [Chroococcus sp. FPU101]|nr:hypothetical protein CFPU101_17030 [Chroococcus sp. FPU101]